MSKYKVFSTFTGAGGLDIGFHGDFEFLGRYYESLGFETIKAIEINKDACLTIENDNKYFKFTEVINEDILGINPEDFKEDIDVFLGGFPCVSFSMVGERKGVDDSVSGRLYDSYARFVEAIKPKVFLAENVKGILSANNGEAIKIIIDRFEKTGYKVKYKLVNFADFGVPQLRERVIFVGVREDINKEFEFPEGSFMGNHVTSKEAFVDINPDCPNNNKMKQADKTKKMLEAIPEGGNYKDLPPELSIKAFISSTYRRLDRNKPSLTVLASGGGGTWGYHYEEPRALTNRERARLQSFPDDLIFSGSNAEVRRQIGNAVPPVGVYAIAKQIKELLD